MQWWFIEDGKQVLSVKLLVFEYGCGAVRMMFLPEDPTQVFRLWIGGNSCSPNADAARRRPDVQKRMENDSGSALDAAPSSP